MTKIAAFKFKAPTVSVYPEIWDAKAKQLKPIQPDTGFSVYEILDSITLAAEAGVLSEAGWPSQIFANREALDEFLSELSGYDECYRINDRWWHTLAALAGRMEEYGFVSCQEIADGLLETVGKDAFSVAEPPKPAAKRKATAKA